MNNTIKYVKFLESTGIGREQAEAHIQIITEILEGDLVNKQDLLNSEKRIEASVNQLDSKVESAIKRLDAKIDTAIGQLDTKIDAAVERLDAKIDTAIERLDTKIDTAVVQLDTKIDTAVEKLEHKIMQSEYRSTIKLGSIVTVIVTVATAVIKFL